MSAGRRRKPWLSVARVLAAIMREREPDYTWKPVEDPSEDTGEERSVPEDDARALGEGDTRAAR